uniref:Guanylate kinase-like domain-containing protein n=1 Tax=Heterorhabditis bacteriophora TaxID=37862 RepID=A0A1I7XH55_HETBA
MLVKTVDPLLARMGGAGDQIANFARIDSHSKSVNSMPCRPIVLSGPSGGGKSTIINRAMAEYPNSFAFSVSHTTRKPRDSEQHGVHYWFTERSEMDKMIMRGDFLEYATFGGNTYGTRLHHAQQDLEAVNNDPTLFDLVIINDDLEVAYNQFIAAIQDDLNASNR